jgi:hypothetical protein
MTTTNAIDPRKLREELIAHARRGDVIAVDFVSGRALPCIAVGKAAVVQEAHLVLSLGTGDVTSIALARVTVVELVSQGRRRATESRE